MNHIQLSHVSALIYLKQTKVAAENYITNEKALRETQTLHAACGKAEPKHFCPAADPLPGGSGWPKFNQLEMVTTFTYRSSLVKIDAHNFELSW